LKVALKNSQQCPSCLAMSRSDSRVVSTVQFSSNHHNWTNWQTSPI